MLSRHVVFRQTVRWTLAGSISTAVTEVPKPRPRGRPRKTPTAEEPARNAASIELPPRRGPGRPRKLALVDKAPVAVVDATARPSPESFQQDAQSDKIQAVTDGPKRGRPRGKAVKTTGTKRTRGPKQRLSSLTSAQKHYDLASFEKYAVTENLRTDTSVYRGNHYEYTVMESLKQYGFTFQKTGRANDLGIDLLGTWHLPAAPHELRVLAQCKACKPRPAFVRELEGAYSGAPAGWKDGKAMALLVTRDPATQGVRMALQRSQQPIGFIQITEIGLVKQFFWNHAATESRLTGMGVTNMYGNADEDPSSHASGRLPGVISLHWEGKTWPSARSSLENMQGLLGESQHEIRLSD